MEHTLAQLIHGKLIHRCMMDVIGNVGQRGLRMGKRDWWTMEKDVVFGAVAPEETLKITSIGFCRRSLTSAWRNLQVWLSARITRNWRNTLENYFMPLSFQGNVTAILLVMETWFARIIYVSTVNISLSQMVKLWTLAHSASWAQASVKLRG